MPRPVTKESLIQEINKELGALEKISGDAHTRTNCPSPVHWVTWTVKDVLAHLAEWEQMCLSWFTAGPARAREPANSPPPGYNWAQTPALNQKIFEKYHDRPLEDILTWFAESNRQIITLVEQLSEEDLVTPGRFPPGPSKTPSSVS